MWVADPVAARWGKEYSELANMAGKTVGSIRCNEKPTCHPCQRCVKVGSTHLEVHILVILGDVNALVIEQVCQVLLQELDQLLQQANSCYQGQHSSTLQQDILC